VAVIVYTLIVLLTVVTVGPNSEVVFDVEHNEAN
jgi:hypothetical protein